LGGNFRRSWRDSQTPSSAFFHERCVATANAVKVDPLPMVFVSASPPMNPIRVSRREIIRRLWGNNYIATWAGQAGVL
jgi:hypothetical protein